MTDRELKSGVIPLGLSAFFLIVAGVLDSISAARYFWICALASLLSGTCIGVSAWPALSKKAHKYVRLACLVTLVIAVPVLLDSTGRAVYWWPTEKGILALCKLARECSDVRLTSVDRDLGVVVACGNNFEFDRLGISVHLKQNGRVVGAGFVQPDGSLKGDGSNCGPELWNKGVRRASLAR